MCVWRARFLFWPLPCRCLLFLRLFFFILCLQWKLSRNLKRGKNTRMYIFILKICSWGSFIELSIILLTWLFLKSLLGLCPGAFTLPESETNNTTRNDYSKYHTTVPAVRLWRAGSTTTGPKLATALSVSTLGCQRQHEEGELKSRSMLINFFIFKLSLLIEADVPGHLWMEMLCLPHPCCFLAL